MHLDADPPDPRDTAVKHALLGMDINEVETDHSCMSVAVEVNGVASRVRTRLAEEAAYREQRESNCRGARERGSSNTATPDTRMCDESLVNHMGSLVGRTTSHHSPYDDAAASLVVPRAIVRCATMHNAGSTCYLERLRRWGSWVAVDPLWRVDTA